MPAQLPTDDGGYACCAQTKQITQITATASNGYVSVTPASYIINPSGWENAPTFSVNPVNDDVETAESYTSTISHTMSSDDALFDGTAPKFFPSSQVRSETSVCNHTCKFPALLRRIAQSILLHAWF